MTGLQHASAFVIQFRTGKGAVTGKLAGRVEHVMSGCTETFQSVEELPELLRQMLKKHCSQNQSDPDCAGLG
jgi:hypothetical protein